MIWEVSEGDGQSFEMIHHWLWERAPIFFLCLNSSGKVTGANRFTRQLLGGEVEGKTANDIFLTFGEPLDLSALRADPQSPHLLHVSTAMGLPESFHFHFFPIGEGTWVLGGLEVHETLRLRKELVAINNQLNSLTRELQKKNHELEELNQLKNHFLGMAAHDLRKPVNSILSYSEFLLEEVTDLLTVEQREFLRTIHTSTDLMRRLIDDFLDIAMIESGRLELHLFPSDILEPLNRSVNLYRFAAQKRGIAIRILQEDSIPPFLMDDAKIEQVFNNLLSNAIEHSPSNSEVTIRISSSGQEVIASVTDCGEGLSEEERAKLFSYFGRGKTRKQNGTRSTGLGLAISKLIVEAHQGKIWVESQPGKGATFSFRLPTHHQQ